MFIHNINYFFIPRLVTSKYFYEQFTMMQEGGSGL